MFTEADTFATEFKENWKQNTVIVGTAVMLVKV